MTTDGAVELFVKAILVAAKFAGPMLLAALVVGIVVGILQAATQVNEASISFLTKLVAIFLTLAATGAWSVKQLVDYTSHSISSIADVTR